MPLYEVQHWIIIGLLVLHIVLVAIVASWSIGKVTIHLERQFSVLRDISGFMLILTSMEKVRSETHYQATSAETPPATVTVSAERVSTEVSR